MPKHILMVVTSHAELSPERRTGVWFDEFALPWIAFRDAGAMVSVASPAGGAAPLDPNSLADLDWTPRLREAETVLARTERLDPRYHAGDFDALFFPGGHGAVFDFPGNVAIQRLISEFAQAGKPVAAVCHGPACFIKAVDPMGTPWVRGRRMTAFTNAEEAAVGLSDTVPFLLASTLTELGANVITAPDWSEHVVTDGWLITGQNPQSSQATARTLLEALSSRPDTAPAT